MFSLLRDKQKLSWEISTALWVLGYNPEMMRWRRVHYDMRSKLLLPLNKLPENFGPAKVDIQLTGGKQDGSSIWNSGDEDMMIILDRYVCVDEKHIDQHKEDTEHVYFQIEEVQGSPGYVYLKKCPLTKLDIDNSVIDRLVSTSLNENGYLSSQKWNTIIYENCKTSEEQVKEQVKGLVKIGMITDKAVTDFLAIDGFIRKTTITLTLFSDTKALVRTLLIYFMGLSTVFKQRATLKHGQSGSVAMIGQVALSSIRF